ncbi:hypothetical protein ACTVKO_23965 [Serratia nevei]|uniref:hypothetical protein n=1 Tax=Serratia nevei TaxID=2703794 RepID=UPI003FA69964
MTPLHRLAVMAINTLLEHDAITLETSEADGKSREKAGHIFTELAGKPTVINWDDIGFEELRISVWWDYDHSKHPQAYPDLPDSDSRKEKFRTTQPLGYLHHYPKFVGVKLSFWFERQDGKWIQCRNGKFNGVDCYVRKDMQAALEALPAVEPNGFESVGKFYL